MKLQEGINEESEAHSAENGMGGRRDWRVSDVARLTEIRFQSNVSHQGCVFDPHLRIPSPNKNKFTANAARKSPSSDA
jgi:hypothetical protein